MKKKIISLVAFLSFSLALLASNDKGIELYKAGMFDAALDVFAQQTNQTSEEQAITAYYKGLIYASEQNLEAAGAEFQKAIDLAPKLAYGYIGKGRLALKNDVKAGETVLKQAEGLGKKNADVLVKVAEAYFANNMTTKALPLIAKAKAADKKNADIYLLEGDMALVPTMSSETIGKAINRYEDAEFFSDNTNKIALLKLAQMYRMTGIYNIALEKVNQAIALDKDFLPIYVELANIQYAQSKFTEWVAMYEKGVVRKLCFCFVFRQTI